MLLSVHRAGAARRIRLRTYNSDMIRTFGERNGLGYAGAVKIRARSRRSAMDLYKAIQDLYAEKDKLERVIASLEELQRTANLPPVLPKVQRRGRKSMNAKEREEVSERMKKYWAGRRKQESKS